MDHNLNTNENIRESITKMALGREFEHILPPGAIKAAVFMPLVEVDGKLSLLFEVRSKLIGQAGEVCFPGGRIEEGESPLDAAVRETMEELELDRKNIEVTAPMFRLTGPAGADIFAYLGFLNNYKGTYSKDETQYVFTLTIEELLDIEPLTSGATFVQTPGDDFPYDLIPNGRNYHWANIKREYYFYKTKYGVIWGLTGQLLYHLLGFLKNAGEHI